MVLYDSQMSLLFQIYLLVLVCLLHLPRAHPPKSFTYAPVYLEHTELDGGDVVLIIWL